MWSEGTQEGGESEVHKEERRTIVSVKTKQDGETQTKYDWVESSVWTEQMLTALERGLKGGKWFSLIDKVYTEKNLKAACEKVKKNKGAGGIDGQSIEKFEAGEEKYLRELREDLRGDKYRPKAVKRVWIEKKGRKDRRPIGIPDCSLQLHLFFLNKFLNWCRR